MFTPGPSSTSLIANPTPPRTADSVLNSYRLLYRGALSLPDSHLLLDGLTFVARLDSPSKNNHLLENPLALALESMRGRPSLRFMGVVKLHDHENFWLDESGDIEMDIHPRATLTQIYFENVFCLTPFASTSTSAPPNTADIGIKVALGDSVARLMAHPPPPQTSFRLPRPDDPTPRKPPILYTADGDVDRPRPGLTRIPSLTTGRQLKRVGSATSMVGPKHKKVAGVDGTVMADLGSGVRLGNTNKGSGLFKVPEIPLHGKSTIKGKGKQVEGDKDVFGTSSLLKPISKGKRKRDPDQGPEIGELERKNKDASSTRWSSGCYALILLQTIKRCTLNHLYKRKDPTTSVRLDKSHPEFKELFNYISRGVVFALVS
ncbi:hypothetical protein C0993_010613 [Termitomyces sp. T159_Od127]|nr:hypothetical protein C0993_010613 [Termitomyces sp. T159_Od127]